MNLRTVLKTRGLARALLEPNLELKMVACENCWCEKDDSLKMQEAWEYLYISLQREKQLQELGDA